MPPGYHSLKWKHASGEANQSNILFWERYLAGRGWEVSGRNPHSYSPLIKIHISDINVLHPHSAKCPERGHPDLLPQQEGVQPKVTGQQNRHGSFDVTGPSCPT